MAFSFDLAPQPLASVSSSPSITMPDHLKTTLWMGELEQWMDEQYISQLWFSLNEKVIAKVIRDKVTGISAGYAFVDFGSTAAAQRALSTFNGVMMPNTRKPFKLNWASGGGLIDRREDRQPEYSIFVGDLGPDCTETGLWAAFHTYYPSCKSAKIMTDPRTGVTRGYGFVRFSDPMDQKRAMVEMQGYMMGSRPIRVSAATPKTRSHSAAASLSTPTSPHQSPFVANDPTNTTVFVGGLSVPISEDDLQCLFSPFGDIIQVKIPPGKGCGFVQYALRQSAELAIQQMNGYPIGNARIRLSWGRSQNDKTAHATTAISPVLLPRASVLSLGAAASAWYPNLPAQSTSMSFQNFDLAMASHPVSTPSSLLQQEMSLNHRTHEHFGMDEETHDIFVPTRSLLDKKTSNGTMWSFNQVYAQ